MKKSLEVDELQEQYNQWYKEKGKAAAYYNEFLRYAEMLLGELGAQEGMFLDVCCGDGSLPAVAMKIEKLRVFGTDLSGVAVKKARKVTGQPCFSVSNAELMPYPDNAFDWVTCLGSLEHLPHPERGASEIARVMKPDGRALIFVPNIYFLGHIFFAVKDGRYPSEGGQEFSEMFSTRQGWTDLLEKAGLKVQRTVKYNRIWATEKVPGFVTFLWNMFSIFIPEGLSYSFIFICGKGK